MAFFVHKIVVTKDEYPKLHTLIEKLATIPEVTNHGWGHDSRGRLYMVHAGKDLSQMFKKWGFKVSIYKIPEPK